MKIVYQVFEYGLVLELIAFVLVILYLAVTGLSIKNTAMHCVKRLYERPLNSAKAIGATGRGIVLQEKVRVERIAGAAKVMAGNVMNVAGDVKTVAQSIKPGEIKGAVGNVKATLQFVDAVKQVAQAFSKQRSV